MCPRTDLWEPWAGNRPGPPGHRAMQQSYTIRRWALWLAGLACLLPVDVQGTANARAVDYLGNVVAAAGTRPTRFHHTACFGCTSRGITPRPAWHEPAWETQRIDQDYAFAVSAANGMVYFGSSADHAVHAVMQRRA